MRLIALTLALLVAGCSGCRYDKPTDITTGRGIVAQPSSGFNTETYVWENFNYSTNVVNTID